MRFQRYCFLLSPYNAFPNPSVELHRGQTGGMFLFTFHTFLPYHMLPCGQEPQVSSSWLRADRTGFRDEKKLSLPLCLGFLMSGGAGEVKIIDASLIETKSSVRNPPSR
jgi:hypothetical protein